MEERGSVRREGFATSPRLDKDSLDFQLEPEELTAQERKQDTVPTLRNLQTRREDTFNQQKQSSELIIMTEHIGKESSQA